MPISSEEPRKEVRAMRQRLGSVVFIMFKVELPAKHITQGL
jgi:hypothetical protein